MKLPRKDQYEALLAAFKKMRQSDMPNRIRVTLPDALKLLTSEYRCWQQDAIRDGEPYAAEVCGHAADRLEEILGAFES